MPKTLFAATIPNMKKHCLFVALSFLLCAPVQAQPVESEPLGPAPYTLKNETDPMALGTGNDTDVQPVKPATDYAPLEASDAPETIIPSMPAPQQAEPSTAYPIDAPPPHVVRYPRSNVSGTPPQDTSKFENKVFCTFKMSFGSYAAGTDKKSGDAVKSYLDGQADKVKVLSKNWGREGEYDYCIIVKEHKDKAEIYKSLKKLIPTPGTEKGPVSLSGEGFTTINTDKKRFEN